jgi:hypothetical protein
MLYARKNSRYTPGGRKYGDLALQVGGVSDETAKYGYGFWATRTIEWLHYKLQTHPLVREVTPQKQDRKISESKIPTGSNIWSQVPELVRYQDILTDIYIVN